MLQIDAGHGHKGIAEPPDPPYCCRDAGADPEDRCWCLEQPGADLQVLLLGTLRRVSANKLTTPVELMDE
jgi:hypothetical protein